MTTTDEVLRVLAALEAAWTGDDPALESLAAGGPGEKRLSTAIADYAETAMQSLLGASFGVHDATTPVEVEVAVERMRADRVAQMANLLIKTLKMWATGPSDLRTVDDMAHVLISAILLFTDDGDQDQVLPMLAALRTAALGTAD